MTLIVCRVSRTVKIVGSTDELEQEQQKHLPSIAMQSVFSLVANVSGHTNDDTRLARQVLERCSAVQQLMTTVNKSKRQMQTTVCNCSSSLLQPPALTLAASNGQPAQHNEMMTQHAITRVNRAHTKSYIA